MGRRSAFASWVGLVSVMLATAASASTGLGLAADGDLSHLYRLATVSDAALRRYDGRWDEGVAYMLDMSDDGHRGDRVGLWRDFLSAPPSGAVTKRSQEADLRVDLILGLDGIAGRTTSKGSSLWVGTVTPSLVMPLGGGWRAHARVTSRVESGDLWISPYAQERTTYDRGNLRMPNVVETALTWGTARAGFSVGRQRVSWGLGQNGQLALSDNSGTKPMLRGRYAAAGLRYAALAAVLEGPKDGPYRRPKYLFAHRLERSLGRRVTVALLESVVVGDRLDPKFLSPLDIYYLDTSSTSPDNRNIGVQWGVFPGVQANLYGELFIDDFQPQEGGRALRAWGTKGGVMVGALWLDPFGLSDLDVSGEYTFVNQYAYTHRRPDTEYTDGDRLLGHHIGTDADSLWLRATWYLRATLKGVFEAERQRHGAGDVTKPYVAGSGAPKTWAYLSGVVETRVRARGTVVRGAPGARVWTLSGTYVTARNFGNVTGARDSHWAVRVGCALPIVRRRG